jgi:hypothetical protein
MLTVDIASDVLYIYKLGILKNYTLIIFDVFSITLLISIIGIDHHQFQSTCISKYGIEFLIAIKQYIWLSSTQELK